MDYATQYRLDQELTAAVNLLDEQEARDLQAQGARIDARILGPISSLVPAENLARRHDGSVRGPYSTDITVAVLGQAVHARSADKNNNPTVHTRRAILALRLGADINGDAICRREFGGFLAYVVGELPPKEFTDFLALPGVLEKAQIAGSNLFANALGRRRYYGDDGINAVQNAQILADPAIGLRVNPYAIMNIIDDHAGTPIGRHIQRGRETVDLMLLHGDIQRSLVDQIDEVVRDRLAIVLPTMTYLANSSGQTLEEIQRREDGVTEREKVSLALQTIGSANRFGLDQTADLLRTHFARDLGRPFIVAHRESFGYDALGTKDVAGSSYDSDVTWWPRRTFDKIWNGLAKLAS